MSLVSNKILLANTATNTAGAFIQTTTIATGTAAIGSNGAIIPAGLWHIPPTTNVVIQINTSTNLAAPTWANIAAVNAAAFVMSDGYNFQAISSNTFNLTVTLYGSNGGTNVTGSSFLTS